MASTSQSVSTDGNTENALQDHSVVSDGYTFCGLEKEKDYRVIVVAKNGAGVSVAQTAATTADSHHIVYIGDQTTDGANEVYLTSGDFFEMRCANHLPDGPRSAASTSGHDPRWAPDGSQVAFTAHYDGHDHDELFVAALDGKGPTRISIDAPEGTTQKVLDYSWSPDSKHLLYRVEIVAAIASSIWSRRPRRTAICGSIRSTQAKSLGTAGRRTALEPSTTRVANPRSRTF